MVARVSTIAFQGIEGVPVDVQVMVAPGKIGMNIVGLPDKAVAESRERVQAALHASGLAMPSKKITVNLAPADLPKEGSHFDLPIALGLMAAIGAIPSDALHGYVVLGELNLDGLDISEQQVEALFELDPAEWSAEADSAEEYFAQFGAKVPSELERQLSSLRARIDQVRESSAQS